MPNHNYRSPCNSRIPIVSYKQVHADGRDHKENPEHSCHNLDSIMAVAYIWCVGLFERN